MTLLTKASHLFPEFSSNLMDFFNEDRNWPKGLTSKMPAVNITENEKSYSLALAAPGLEKDDFQIKSFFCSYFHFSEKEAIIIVKQKPIFYQVSEPRKVGVGLGAHSVFTVATKTNVGYFKRKEMKVTR